MYLPEQDGALLDAAPNVSPFLQRPLRTETEAFAQAVLRHCDTLVRHGVMARPAADELRAFMTGRLPRRLRVVK
jgi:hypothetical protein